MHLIQSIHEKALELAAAFKRAEHELLTILQEVEANRVFEKMGYNSLFTYATSALKLSEGYSYALISVARKAKQVPELKEAIAIGGLSVSRAKKISSVITPENSSVWIERAKTLTQRELEKAVVTVNPKAAIERMSFVATDRVQFQCGISEKLMRKIERAQDLLSQRLKRSASMEDVLEVLTSKYLQSEDPVSKAERAKKIVPAKARFSRIVPRVIPMAVKHQVALRDQGQCSFVNSDGQRCGATRFVQMHHVQPLAMGGAHTTENLATLCFHHHRLFHNRHRQVPARIVT